MEAQKRYTNRFVCSLGNIKFADMLDVCPAHLPCKDAACLPYVHNPFDDVTWHKNLISNLLLCCRQHQKVPCFYALITTRCPLPGFKTSALRKRFLPWYVRPYRVTKTVFTSSLLSCLADWTVTSYIDTYRQVSNHLLNHVLYYVSYIPSNVSRRLKTAAFCTCCPTQTTLCCQEQHSPYM